MPINLSMKHEKRAINQKEERARRERDREREHTLPWYIWDTFCSHQKTSCLIERKQKRTTGLFCKKGKKKREQKL